MNLPADPRHKRQLNGFSGTNEADTPTILTTFLDPIGRFSQFNRATARISYRNFGLGEVILEVVGSPETTSEGPSTFWGITYVVADIDATASFFGDRIAPVKEAVQPGRRIATLLHHELGMSVRSAMISAPARR